ncbi:hypothetical protein HY374_03570, partial [Candidatus Berkelbacteria bacterium]|nr:hypothetical protein [Candidatus Berkelbacteria bacterium]
MKPQIILPDYGAHNADLNRSRDRLIRGSSYKDLSTICVIPTRGLIHARVVQSWMGLLPMMNQKFVRVFVSGMEVGEAYSAAVEMILANPELSKWKYMLTLEEDNIPPPDGLLKLYESIEGGVDGKKYDVVGGLYWTKGQGGQPMIYGEPNVMPRNFIPQPPKMDTLQPCNGLGMGFTLFRIAIFKDQMLIRPFFKTVSECIPGQGSRVYTQD